GLTYSRLLARAQGGDLTLAGSTDAGSTFMLKLRRGHITSYRPLAATVYEKSFMEGTNNDLGGLGN
ncbi:hypothetical protein P9747_18300, partial [Paenibacillus macerans]|nr:hypothetical protein [Paenibacillus macerans]